VKIFSQVERSAYPVLAIGIAVVALVCSAVGASAAGPVKLGMKPVGVAGSYFTLTIQPGESRGLAVELGNYGAEQARARTYAADAYSLVNGGFGARLDSEPNTGTTQWLTYPAGDIDLAPGSAIEREFSVTVPSDARPGEYLTSVVLQNADPTSGDAVGANGGVVFNQIMRQVIAVAIDVPGPRSPAFEVGAISARTVAGRSSIAVEIRNTGNQLLKPTGELVVWDGAGNQLTEFPISMDSLYANTSTYVEVPFAERFQAGDYTAELTMADASGVSATSHRVSIAIPDVAVDTVPQPIGVGPALAATHQAPLPPATPSEPIVLAMIAFGAGMGLMLTAVGVGFIVYRRRRA
jgi:hypothetical protein